MADGGPAEVPGTTGTHAAWPRIVSCCAGDVRALNIACAGAYAGMRAREGANAPVAGAFAAHVHMVPGRTRQGQRTRTRTCFRPTWLCSRVPERPWTETWRDYIERTAQTRHAPVSRTVWRFLLHPVCYRGVRAWCCLPPPIVAEAPSAALGVVRPARGQNRHSGTLQHASAHQRLQ